MNLTESRPAIRQAIAKGLIDLSEAGPMVDERPKFVTSAYEHRISHQVWTLPIPTASEANGRDWRATFEQEPGGLVGVRITITRAAK